MKVYLLMESPALYEAETVEGVYAERDAAEREAERRKLERPYPDTRVEEREVL